MILNHCSVDHKCCPSIYFIFSPSMSVKVQSLTKPGFSEVKKKLIQKVCVKTFFTEVIKTVLFLKKLLQQDLKCSNKTSLASSLVFSLFISDHSLGLLQDWIENQLYTYPICEWDHWVRVHILKERKKERKKMIKDK